MCMFIVPKLAMIGTPCVNLLRGPTRRCSLASSYTNHNFPPERVQDLLRGSLYGFVDKLASVRLNNISQLCETIQSPAEHFTCLGDGEGMVLSQSNRNDHVFKLRKRVEIILHLLATPEPFRPMSLVSPTRVQDGAPAPTAETTNPEISRTFGGDDR